MILAPTIIGKYRFKGWIKRSWNMILCTGKGETAHGDHYSKNTIDLFYETLSESCFQLLEK